MFEIESILIGTGFIYFTDPHLKHREYLSRKNHGKGFFYSVIHNAANTISELLNFSDQFEMFHFFVTDFILKHEFPVC